MDPKDQPQFNPNTPISEVLRQEQTGFVPTTPKINDVVNAIGDMYDSTKNLGATETMPKTAPAPKIAPTVPLPSSAPVRIIKTFRSDAAEAVKMQQQPSVAKIAIAQERRRREQGEEIGAKPKKRTGLLLTAIILILLGAAAIPTVQYILNQKKAEVPVAADKTVIPFDREETLTLDNETRNNFLDTLDAFSIKPSATPSIEYIKVLEKIPDINDSTKTINRVLAPDVFAEIIGPNMSSALERSFDPNYMYGVENSSNPASFVIFKTSSYQQTFAGMLGWETKMVTDLSPILNLKPDALGRPFADQVLINKDIRAITATDGTIIFLYGFLDDQTLVITTSAQTFQDINSRYVTSHFVQ